MQVVRQGSSQRFLFDPEASFSCTSCGKCCRSGFEIPVQGDKAKAIISSEPHQVLTREGYTPLKVLAGDYHFLAYTEEGHCHYLREDLCRLHESAGMGLKPAICRLYPLNLVDTPDGLYVSTLFSCPAVVSGTGEPLREQREELEALFSSHQNKVPQLPPIREHVLVTSMSTVTWPGYKRLEAKMLQAYKPTRPIQCLLKFAFQLICEEPDEVDFSEDIPELGELLDLYFLPFLAEILAYLEAGSGHPEPEEFLSFLQCDSPVHSERLDCQLSSLEVLNPSSQLLVFVVERYVRNQFHGKLLLSGPSLVARLLLVAAGLSVLLLDIQSRQKAEGVLHFSFHHLEEAFETCEERLVSQCNDLEPLLVEFEEALIGLRFPEI